MRVEWDDDLFRYQPRIMEFGQWRIGRWVAARVTAWAAWACYFVPFFLAGRLLLGASPLYAFMWGAAFAAGAAYLTANFLTPETPARGWWQLLRDEWRTATAAYTYRRPVPVRVSTASVRRHEETP